MSACTGESLKEKEGGRDQGSLNQKLGKQTNKTSGFNKHMEGRSIKRMSWRKEEEGEQMRPKAADLIAGAHHRKAWRGDGQ